MEEKKILYTKDPYKELLMFASENKCEVEELDFRLLSFSTSYTYDNQKWIKVNEKELKIFEEDEKFLNHDLNIEQEYKIEIYFKKFVRSPAFEISLHTNEICTLLKANVRASEVIAFHDKLALELLEAIYKAMIKEKYLLGFRNFDFKKQIIDFNTKVKEKQKFDFEVEFEVCKGVDPQEPTNEEIKYHYLENLKKHNDVMNRNYVAPIGKDEVAIEKIKPKEGSDGKDLRFKILKTLPPKTNKEKVICSDNFETKEDDESIKYIAKKDGFIIQRKSIYEIENYLEFSKVDFKSTGSIWAGFDKRVIVVIKNTNSLEDAVGPRITVEAQELEVTGNIAQDSVLRGKKVVLKGNMHHKSTIIGQKVEVNILRGYCEAQELEAETLENGIIKAKKVNIKKAIGGEIIADEIYIQELGGNCFCSAKSLINIEKIQGSGNKLVIQDLKAFDKEKSGEEILLHIEELKKEQEALAKEIEDTKHIIHVSKDSVRILQQKVKELMSAKRAIPQAYKATIKDFNQKIESLSVLANKIETSKEEEKANIEKLKKIQDELLQSKIINKSGKWTDLNEIKFNLLNPRKVLSYHPHSEEKIQCFELEKIDTENGTSVYEIRSISNYKEEAK
ncbi:FapA family protein [Campylobacter sp. CNRCH_2013_0855]|uniref:FapA family protein n=1 Tax=unclassified Campylobacter TaxID=2593542 RepID=UPI0021E63E10|nr:FapA family protein [Campylobacter sp. CNRCH_2013_0855]MCR8686042.1 FapA family protein [Campylobacter sp. 1569]MCV3552020.1 FapA family protein [Campylobacter sp. CNRCH_2013_0855]